MIGRDDGDTSDAVPGGRSQQDLPAARVLENVARQLGDGSRDQRLARGVETEIGREFAPEPAGLKEVSFFVDLYSRFTVHDPVSGTASPAGRRGPRRDPARYGRPVCSAQVAPWPSRRPAESPR